MLPRNSINPMLPENGGKGQKAVSTKMNEPEIIWHNGKYIPWHHATTHVLSHAYGSSVFEGIRVYDRLGKPVGFRMREHLDYPRQRDPARPYHGFGGA